jgi:hypothetical protein
MHAYSVCKVSVVALMVQVLLEYIQVWELTDDTQLTP